jgi:2-amino-4-hydroxy-6-hydroxymethyldihydropteridine diphosphokinase
MGVRAVVGMGSNVGDRIANLREAVLRVARFATVAGRSRVYETAPVGGPPQATFLNAAILVETELGPLALLDGLQRVERELGRTRDVRWGPRTLDLDVLWIEGVTVQDPRLEVPHPRLASRAFALAPLLDVAPSAPYAAPDDPGVRVTELAL